jgi:hypothetical protein
MRVLLSAHGLRGDAEAMVGIAVRLGAPGAAAQPCDAPVAAGVMPTGGWR